MKKILLSLSVFFVFLSFSPTLYEIYYRKNLSPDRAYEAVHNYVFDYNFYLSRIREGQEGKWLVTEKYYNKPHPPSLFQIFYLYLGKLGGVFRFAPPVIYHAARVILGLVLLVLLGKLVSNFFAGIWQLVAYFFVVTAGSWPILVKLADGAFRFSTYWGGWSVIDPLLRITFIPHVLLGQIFLVLFVWKYSQTGPAARVSQSRAGRSLALPTVALFLGSLARVTRLWNLKWAIVGFLAGIIFPPVLVTVYVIFAVLSLMEFIFLGAGWLKAILPRIVFVLFSLPALLYAQIMFKVEPWRALALFDVHHRSILPYAEYALALGPMLPLGLAGLLLAFVRKERKFFPFVSWILALGLLFAIFEKVPQQSPTRFTQMLINLPLGILATYLFYSLWGRWGRWGIIGVTVGIILLGFGVMASMVGWKIDEVKGKMGGTWLYPVGVELVYPLKDFMAGIDYLRLNTKINDVVLAYEAAGNYIPAYAGNFVYLGHANTPDEDGKLKISARFFKGEMSEREAKEFLLKENIKYIYFGPQERDVGNLRDLSSTYKLLTPIFTNSRVTIYKVGV